jgi:hypothetical protein
MFMDKPSFVISDKTGQRIIRWCQSGKSVESVLEMINAAITVEQLRDILKNYPDYRIQTEPLAIERKNVLDNPIVEHVNS